MIKNKLRKFSGFEFDAESDEYNTKLEAVQKIDVAKLKGVCEGLTLDKKGKTKSMWVVFDLQTFFYFDLVTRTEFEEISSKD